MRPARSRPGRSRCSRRYRGRICRDRVRRWEEGATDLRAPGGEAVLVADRLVGVEAERGLGAGDTWPADPHVQSAGLRREGFGGLVHTDQPGLLEPLAPAVGRDAPPRRPATGTQGLLDHAGLPQRRGRRVGPCLVHRHTFGPVRPSVRLPLGEVVMEEPRVHRLEAHLLSLIGPPGLESGPGSLQAPAGKEDGRSDIPRPGQTSPPGQPMCFPPRGWRRVVFTDAGWSSSVARWAHNPEVAGSNPVPATEGRGPESERVPALGALRLSMCGHLR